MGAGGSKGPASAWGESGRTASVWMATSEPPEFAALGEDLAVDACVVGAGIAGLTTAYLLARHGRAVAVVDAGPVGGGMTGRTTAHLSNAIDDRYTEIERLHGPRGARLAAESHTAAINLIQALANERGIACDFERLDGYLFTPPGESPDVLDRELDAAHRAGLTDVERITRAPLDGFDTGPCLCFPRQGQFHPLKYLTGLASALVADGGRVFTGTRAASIEGGTPARVVTADGRVIAAGAVVVATNSPVNDRLPIHSKQAPYLTYVIGATVPRGSMTRALYWDTLDPYHYVRLQPAPSGSGDVLIVGGEDHKTGEGGGDADARYSRLEAWARERFSEMQEVAYRWSGQVMETFDGLAFIGRDPGGAANVYVATGDSGMGMTHGTIAGRLLADLILGRENAWARLYDPARKTLGAAREWFKENVDVAAHYAAWLTPGEVASADAIAPGTGAVLRRGLTKVAVYRDDQGALHERSAACVHLGCVVAWNPNEQTWDCPCHGSRFDRFGRVINGPANADLPPAGASD